MLIVGEGWRYLTAAERDWLVHVWYVPPRRKNGVTLATLPFVRIADGFPARFDLPGFVGRTMWKLHCMLMDDLASLEAMLGHSGEPTWTYRSLITVVVSVEVR